MLRVLFDATECEPDGTHSVTITSDPETFATVAGLLVSFGLFPSKEFDDAIRFEYERPIEADRILNIATQLLGYEEDT